MRLCLLLNILISNKLHIQELQDNIIYNEIYQLESVNNPNSLFFTKSFALLFYFSIVGIIYQILMGLVISKTKEAISKTPKNKLSLTTGRYLCIIPQINCCTTHSEQLDPEIRGITQNFNYLLAESKLKSPGDLYKLNAKPFECSRALIFFLNAAFYGCISTFFLLFVSVIMDLVTLLSINNIINCDPVGWKVFIQFIGVCIILILIPNYGYEVFYHAKLAKKLAIDIKYSKIVNLLSDTKFYIFLSLIGMLGHRDWGAPVFSMIETENAIRNIISSNIEVSPIKDLLDLVIDCKKMVINHRMLRFSKLPARKLTKKLSGSPTELESKLSGGIKYILEALIKKEVLLPWFWWDHQELILSSILNCVTHYQSLYLMSNEEKLLSEEISSLIRLNELTTKFLKNAVSSEKIIEFFQILNENTFDFYWLPHIFDFSDDIMFRQRWEFSETTTISDEKISKTKKDYQSFFYCWVFIPLMCSLFFSIIKAEKVVQKEKDDFNIFLNIFHFLYFLYFFILAPVF